MKLSYEFGTQTIEFEVIYRDKKNLTIEVEAPNIITAIAPIGTSEEIVLSMVKKKSVWIVQKLFEIREVEYRKREKQYVNGEGFIYLGRNYSLQIELQPNLEKAYSKLIRGKFCVYSSTKDEHNIKEALEEWFKEKAKEKISERIAYYQSYFDEKPKGIKIKEQQKRWGSCTSKKELLFNWKCIMAPSPVLDYIVVHEMAHMVYMNHSKEFWHLVKKVLPDYVQRKEWLRNNGIKYDL